MKRRSIGRAIQGLGELQVKLDQHKKLLKELKYRLLYDYLRSSKIPKEDLILVISILRQPDSVELFAEMVRERKWPRTRYWRCFSRNSSRPHRQTVAVLAELLNKIQEEKNA